MTQKTYILDQLHGYGYRKFEEIPEEMFDYIPEFMELSNEEREERYLEELILN